MSSVRGGNGRRTTVELGIDQNQFLDDFIAMIRKHTGIKLSRSDVICSTLDMLRELDFSRVDFKEEYERVRALSALLDTRRAIEREMRQTESDLHQALVHSTLDGDTVKNFRRNLRYQSSRMDSLMEQVDQCQNGNGGSNDEAARVVQRLLVRRLKST